MSFCVAESKPKEKFFTRTWKWIVKLLETFEYMLIREDLETCRQPKHWEHSPRIINFRVYIIVNKHKLQWKLKALKPLRQNLNFIADNKRKIFLREIIKNRFWWIFIVIFLEFSSFITSFDLPMHQIFSFHFLIKSISEEKLRWWSVNGNLGVKPYSSKLRISTKKIYK